MLGFPSVLPIGLWVPRRQPWSSLCHQHPAQGLTHGRCSKGFDRSRVRLLFMVSEACCVSSLPETWQISAHPLAGILPTTPFPTSALGLAAPTALGLWDSTFRKSTELIHPGLYLHYIWLTLCPQSTTRKHWLSKLCCAGSISCPE